MEKYKPAISEHGNYMQLSRPLIQELGLKDAIFLCELVDHHDMLAKCNRMSKDHSFYYTCKDVESSVSLTEYTQVEIVKRLKRRGLIDRDKKKGKYWYTIHMDMVLAILDDIQGVI